MSNGVPDSARWLQVIGKGIAYLCVEQVAKSDPARVNDLLGKIEFLKGIGLSEADAALLVGSSAASVRTLKSRKRRNSRAKKKKR